MERYISGLLLLAFFVFTTLVCADNNGSVAALLPEARDLKHDLTLLYILNNYTDIEGYLEGYLHERRYAELKELIDEIKEKIPQVESNEYDAFEKIIVSENGSIPNEVLNLKPADLEIIEAYQNATVYNVIYALWNWKVRNVLPEIDQNAILEYYGERQVEEKSRQSLFSKLWTLIKNLFRHKADDEGCHANEPECIRQVVTGLDDEQRNRLERAAREGNLTEISTFMEEKICELPSLQNEYYNWNEQNDVPQALREIVDGLSEPQLRAMENLRKLELKDAIKDYYRGMIERRNFGEQQEIENFFQRMNKTFAKCYNPAKLKESSREIATKIEEWRR